MSSIAEKNPISTKPDEEAAVKPLDGILTDANSNGNGPPPSPKKDNQVLVDSRPDDVEKNESSQINSLMKKIQKVKRVAFVVNADESKENDSFELDYIDVSSMNQKSPLAEVSTDALLERDNVQRNIGKEFEMLVKQRVFGDNLDSASKALRFKEEQDRRRAEKKKRAEEDYKLLLEMEFRQQQYLEAQQLACMHHLQHRDFKSQLEIEMIAFEKKRNQARQTALEAMMMAEQRRMREMYVRPCEPNQHLSYQMVRPRCDISYMPVQYSPRELEKIRREKFNKQVRIDAYVRAAQREREFKERHDTIRRFEMSPHYRTNAFYGRYNEALKRDRIRKIQEKYRQMRSRQEEMERLNANNGGANASENNVYNTAEGGEPFKPSNAIYNTNNITNNNNNNHYNVAEGLDLSAYPKRLTMEQQYNKKRWPYAASIMQVTPHYENGESKVYNYSWRQSNDRKKFDGFKNSPPKYMVEKTEFGIKVKELKPAETLKFCDDDDFFDGPSTAGHSTVGSSDSNSSTAVNFSVIADADNSASAIAGELCAAGTSTGSGAQLRYTLDTLKSFNPEKECVAASIY